MTAVLVIEDDEDNRQLLLDLLGRAGFEVHASSDGEHVLELARQAEAVIVDLSAPGQSGVDVCRVLRADPAGARLPVVLLSDRAADYQVRAGLAAGADSYLIKPFSPAELVAQLRHLITPDAASTVAVAAAASGHAGRRSGASRPSAAAAGSARSG
jgi:DNA-binding response OmpR family regulator